AAIRRIAATTGGVIFGRAGMAVLADRPLTYRVRLEGPLDRRVRRAAQVEGISEAAARENALAADRARDTYAAHFYKVHRDNWRLYHLLLDATVLDPLDVGELVARAAEAFFAREQERA
ncbi:MAG: cytidylate kinase-like family protein, partial [Actinomycetes bacterium]